MPKTLLYKCWVCSNIAQFGKKSVCYNWCSGRSVDNVFPPLDTPPFVFTSKIVVEKNKAFWEAKNIDLFAKQIIEGFIIWHFHNKWKLQYQFLPDGKFKPAKCAWSSHSQTNGSPWLKKVDVGGWMGQSFSCHIRTCGVCLKNRTCWKSFCCHKDWMTKLWRTFSVTR